ncbi:MAG: hypothetical protein E7544_04080 [Ruminococcaceae bacterium]|nr:hypothetical protein [Oscillospiraceae bacterium]
MDYIIYFCICICAVTVFAFYIRRIVNQYKKSKGITEPYRPEEVKIKTEFDTEKFMGKVIDLSYREEMVGVLTPKLVKTFTVIFKTDDNEKLKIEIPQDMQDGFEVGQYGEITLVEGELYSFVCR